jgi:periplasmic protein TonB
MTLLGSRTDRLRGAFAALAVQALLGWLLVSGLNVSWRRLPEAALTVFRVSPPPPPPAPVAPPPEQRRSPRHRDTAAPPNLRPRATPVVAPPPVLPQRVPPPVVAAPQAATGLQATTGAALVAGPGTGAGGTGDGFGGGGMGNGAGDGSPPRWRRGRLKDQDYPRDAALAGTTGTVAVRYLVQPDGHVGECRIARSSGSAELDATTCRLIQQRFRFEPSRDARGRKVPAWVVESHEWVIDRPPTPVPSS